MTRDEVMAMTDEELRIKAAELMGWDECSPKDTYVNAPIGRPPDEWLEGKNIINTPGLIPVGGKRVVIPDYPNDIAAAWELAEKMRGDDKSVWVDVFANANGWEVEIDDDSTSSIEGDTAACAITRAFILAKEATD